MRGLRYISAMARGSRLKMNVTRGIILGPSLCEPGPPTTRNIPSKNKFPSKNNVFPFFVHVWTISPWRGEGSRSLARPSLRVNKTAKSQLSNRLIWITRLVGTSARCGRLTSLIEDVNVLLLVPFHYPVGARVGRLRLMRGSRTGGTLRSRNVGDWTASPGACL